MNPPHLQSFPFTFCHSSSNVALLVNGDRDKCITSGSLKGRVDVFAGGQGGKFFLSHPSNLLCPKIRHFRKVDCIAFTIPAKILRSEVVSGLA